MRNSGLCVSLNSVSKAYSGVPALSDVSFHVQWGEIVALLGPNGAGKTTTVDILSTLTQPDRGQAIVAGYSVVDRPGMVRKSIMVTGQQVAIDDALTGYENLVMFGRLQGLSKRSAKGRATELLRDFDLIDAARRLVSTYSGGMRRRIDLACGLVVRPEVVFLDEPTTGLDPRSRQNIWELVLSFKREGIATLLTTQYLEEADALSDRIIVIDHGRVIAEGTNDELKERAGVSYCEVIPRNHADRLAIIRSLSPLLPSTNVSSPTAPPDRIAIPAPGGVKTLVEVSRRLQEANIDILEIGLRRPSLDDVFFALTGGNTAAQPHEFVPRVTP